MKRPLRHLTNKNPLIGKLLTSQRRILILLPHHLLSPETYENYGLETKTDKAKHPGAPHPQQCQHPRWQRQKWQLPLASLHRHHRPPPKKYEGLWEGLGPFPLGVPAPSPTHHPHKGWQMAEGFKDDRAPRQRGGPRLLASQSLTLDAHLPTTLSFILRHTVLQRTTTLN